MLNNSCATYVLVQQILILQMFMLVEIMWKDMYVQIALKFLLSKLFT